ncbi:MAG: hypothetical protein HZB66_01790 [Candidatus Aenigmarchaeota archaeon]|nr:hypothetical protein [Candidatus Aenigmarchaeota archaeon]
MVREKLLVLAKTCPVVSKSYEHLVCVAGITGVGEWRRIYPVPWVLFSKHCETKFKKKQWIEYELKSNEPSDHRPESRKIMPESVKPLEEADFSVIKDMLDKKLTTLEHLHKQGHHIASLGAMKPIIEDFHACDNIQEEKLIRMSTQMTLFGTKAMKIDVPEMNFNYIFRCGGQECKGHDMLCLDWELGELHRKCEEYRSHGKYKDDGEVFEKVGYRMMNDMLKKKCLYFIVGTHSTWGTYMIISVIYPRKDDAV